MLRIQHRFMYLIAGAVWLFIGSMLLNLGLKFLVESTQAVSDARLVAWLSEGQDKTIAVILLIVLGLAIGYAKGKFVLAKAVRSTYARINQLPNPAPLSQLYTKGNLLLIGIMVLLGLSMRFLGVPGDIRGLIDVAVGSALISGSLGYIRLGLNRMSNPATSSRQA